MNAKLVTQDMQLRRLVSLRLLRIVFLQSCDLSQNIFNGAGGGIRAPVYQYRLPHW
jgi:hypothetical protein